MTLRFFGPKTIGAMCAGSRQRMNANGAGGAGIYYHFDYHGGPRSYQWVNTSPIAKIWDQMSLAKQYGADRVWIVNVGHFKGYELPTEYFLDLPGTPTAGRTKTSMNTRVFGLHANSESSMQRILRTFYRGTRSTTGAGSRSWSMPGRTAW